MKTMTNQDETGDSDLADDAGQLASLRTFNDAELLDAWARDRCSDAFAVLVQRHSLMVLTVCRRKCRTLADADDAYQSTFLMLARSSGKIRRPECLAGWLHRVAQRAAYATLSRHQLPSESTAEPVTIDDDPLGNITRQHDAIVLDEELASLPEQYRAALVMQLYEGSSLQGMADHFQTTLGSVRGRLQRGKRLLADRLRRRGVVPVLALAAAGSTTVSAGEASAAGASLLATIGSGPLPTPPLSDQLLHPLLASGNRIMNPWNLVVGVSTAAALAALLVLPGLDVADASNNGSDRITVETPFVTQAVAPVIQTDATANTAASTAGQPAAGNVAAGNLAVQPPNVGTAASGGIERVILQRRYRPATAEGPLAESLQMKLDMPIDMVINNSLSNIDSELEKALGLPVILDERAIQYAELDPSAMITHSSQAQPLRTALRKLLSPLGLKATIESEGLVITTDHHALVHHGIGTSKWLNADDQMMRQSEMTLAKPVNFDFDQTPLREAIASISQKLEIPIVIDARGLEEIGIDSEIPVTYKLGELPARDLFPQMLRNLDLTLAVINNVYTVTTREAAEDSLLRRIYWLEGLTLAGDYDSLMSLIETSITPDTWESLGGNSTMAPFPGARPSLIISTTLDVHRDIEKLIETLRENSFAVDPVSEEVEVSVPARGPSGFGGGGGGGGFGGGFGSGGGMGGGGGGFF
ncbi:sigma-70 family RNA polymerase sigma factor [Stieleria sp. TO1_6]|uniref:RNA polymerase sigma factor n=1 Tax=Stieleria tagensis TaxID=2956795 RepID=UPI00209AE550|nr:sigma-70 family RNA polymerase sigma factor [Stieleria tagensis]MCO8122122.1 sigma-70 family RNA polymerase sigma factor [Stieleria tagensis]